MHPVSSPTYILTTVRECLDFIDALDSSLMKLGMDRIKTVLDFLGNPQDTYKTIHVVGTNGKGSTCTILESIYRTAGYKTGLFTSPHLIDLRERVQVNRQMLADADFIALVNVVYDAMKQACPERQNWLTYFEFITVLGFVTFQEQQVDIAIIEAGLGGRLDGTNVIQAPEVIVVTSVSEDHQAILGETLEVIAREKAGVFRNGVPVISSQQVSTVQNELRLQAEKKNTDIVFVETQTVTSIGLVEEMGKQKFETPLGIVNTEFLGRYQQMNIATALSVIDAIPSLSMSTDAILEGINNAVWPARLQYFREQKLIIDGSHNKQGIVSLVDTVGADFKNFKITMGLSLLKTKKLEALLPLFHLENLSDIIIISDLLNQEHHYYSPDELADFLHAKAPNERTKICFKRMALNDFLTFVLPDDCSLKLLTGSLYTAGMALKQVQAL